MPRWGFIVGVLLLAGLQYRLWLAPGGIPDAHALEQKVAQDAEYVAELRARNMALEASVRELQRNLGAVEYHARMDLGMIGDSETFYLIVH